MFRMNRLTDYGIVLLTHFARDPRSTRSARDLASLTHVPRPTVSKVLKKLAQHGVLAAHRGARGGFSLARDPDRITVADVIGAFEGPIAFTECGAHPGRCTIESLCIVRTNWRRINGVVYDALRRMTLSEMAHPMTLAPAPVPVEFRR